MVWWWCHWSSHMWVYARAAKIICDTWSRLNKLLRKCQSRRHKSGVIDSRVIATSVDTLRSFMWPTWATCGWHNWRFLGGGRKWHISWVYFQVMSRKSSELLHLTRMVLVVSDTCASSRKWSSSWRQCWVNRNQTHNLNSSRSVRPHHQFFKQTKQQLCSAAQVWRSISASCIKRSSITSPNHPRCLHCSRSSSTQPGQDTCRVNNWMVLINGHITPTNVFTLRSHANLMWFCSLVDSCTTTAAAELVSCHWKIISRRLRGRVQPQQQQQQQRLPQHSPCHCHHLLNNSV